MAHIFSKHAYYSNLSKSLVEVALSNYNQRSRVRVPRKEGIEINEKEADVVATQLTRKLATRHRAKLAKLNPGFGS